VKFSLKIPDEIHLVAGANSCNGLNEILMIAGANTFDSAQCDAPATANYR
jgi:hypothetical protein